MVSGVDSKVRESKFEFGLSLFVALPLDCIFATNRAFQNSPLSAPEKNDSMDAACELHGYFLCLGRGSPVGGHKY